MKRIHDGTPATPSLCMSTLTTFLKGSETFSAPSSHRGANACSHIRPWCACYMRLTRSVPMLRCFLTSEEGTARSVGQHSCCAASQALCGLGTTRHPAQDPTGTSDPPVGCKLHGGPNACHATSSRRSPSPHHLQFVARGGTTWLGGTACLLCQALPEEELGDPG